MFYKHIHQSKTQTHGAEKKGNMGRKQDIAYINSSYKLNLQIQFRQED